MEKLIEILEQFEQERTKRQNDWNEKAVADCFYPLAEQILCKGYFLINGRYIIDLGAIELYYHEENGTIKDHIMYHTNEHLPKNYKEVIKYEGGYPYFKLGSFNLHTSGVDVTFENQNEKYRASFLIRSYRVLKKENEEDVKGLEMPFDACSTHIFDDMFYSGILLNSNSNTIEWIKKEKVGGIEPCPRRNVAMYRKENDKFEKVSKKDYDDNKEGIKNQVPRPQFFKYGKTEYLKDLRPWQFKRVGIIEK